MKRRNFIDTAGAGMAGILAAGAAPAFAQATPQVVIPIARTEQSNIAGMSRRICRRNHFCPASSDTHNAK